MYRALNVVLLSFQILSASAQSVEPENNIPSFTSEQIREDFKFLYEGLQSANFDLYAFTSRGDFEERYKEINAGFGQPMTRFDAEMEFQQFVALAKQSHTRVESDYAEFFAYLSKGGPVFPLSILVEQGQMLVTGNSGGVSEIVRGDRIIAIGGKPISALLPKLTARISAESSEFAYVLLETYMPLLIWLEFGQEEVANVTIEHASGSRGEYSLALVTDEQQDSDNSDKPFSLEGRDARMLAETVAYLRPGPFYSLDPDSSVLGMNNYLEFVDASFSSFIESGAKQLVLDLRDNPGGDNSYSDPVIAWFADRPFRFSSDFKVRVSPQSTAANQARLDALPEKSNSISQLYAELYSSAKDGQTVLFPIPEVEPRSKPRFDGQVYVLVNRYSFSNAVSAAAVIQDYGFGVIMGEKTVDMATTYGAMEQFILPNTQIIVTYPKALIVRPGGNKKTHPLNPDVQLVVPRIRGQEDVMLEAANQHIQSQLTE